MFCYSVAKSCPTLWDPMVAHQASLSFTISQSLLKLTSIESVMPSNHLILCLPLLLLPSIFPAPGSFPMSWLFVSGCQSIGVSASVPVLPVNIQVAPVGRSRESRKSSGWRDRGLVINHVVWMHRAESVSPWWHLP